MTEAKLSSPGKFALTCAFLVLLRLSLKPLSRLSAILYFGFKSFSHFNDSNDIFLFDDRDMKG